MSPKPFNDPESANISAADSPALRDFLRGYFNEDMLDEYGSAEAAARQFWEDADEKQRKALTREWARLLERNKSLPAANNAIHKLGSAYQFEDDGEIKKVSEVFQVRNRQT
jgi:acyl-CoA reductase-like NAD-dependent aldehyde dehydrogenase